MTDPQEPKIIPPHGGYRDLQSYQMSEIVYDGSVVFCDRFISKRSRSHDRQVQAARSRIFLCRPGDGGNLYRGFQEQGNKGW